MCRVSFVIRLGSVFGFIRLEGAIFFFFVVEVEEGREGLERFSVVRGGEGCVSEKFWRVGEFMVERIYGSV